MHLVLKLWRCKVTRGLDPELNAELEKQVIRPVWIIRLDIKDDPLLVWTGRGSFSPTGTGDPDLDGQIFTGVGDIGEIGAIQDTEKGSKALTLELPGVDLTKPLLAQIVNDLRIWQFREAWIWFGVLDTVNNFVVNPFRVKTGRMDTMTLENNGTEGSIKAVIESHQSFISRALGTRYSEQQDIDPTDISQTFIHDLANKQPGIGVTSSSTDGGIGGGRVGGGFDRPNVRKLI